METGNILRFKEVYRFDLEKPIHRTILAYRIKDALTQLRSIEAVNDITIEHDILECEKRLRAITMRLRRE